MAKEVEVLIKLQVKGGQANPAPPVGPALGAKGVNIMEFCKRFNAATQEQQGKVLPVIISVYKGQILRFRHQNSTSCNPVDGSCKSEKGSPEPNRNKVAKVTWDQVKAIAEDKMADLNCFTIESAMKQIAGTARSMGFTVTGTPPWKGQNASDS
ncbi:MAG: 50S ribosomal protein L11 [Saprospiraceae bacterium]